MYRLAGETEKETKEEVGSFNERTIFSRDDVSLLDERRRMGEKKERRGKKKHCS